METVHLRLETHGRRGKAVTVLQGFTRRPEELEALARTLKAKCGSGGTVKGSMIEIQGDVRARVRDLLLAEGFHVKGV
ncbi:MAG TPA: translation initiation factor [bacterium]|nr:translation initiation factor [bacterium]